MNPGPAPRPPTDRPRLNLTPSTANLPGNMSQLSLHSPLLRTGGTFPTSNSSLGPVLSRSMSLDGAGALSIIKEGSARYKETSSLVRFFSQKHLILRPNQLDILKNPRDQKVYLSIQLKDVTDVSRYDLEPLCIEISRVANPGVTSISSARDLPQKTILLQFKSDQELYEWQDGIYTRCPAISGVSNPTNFAHRVHVGFDPTNGNFVGLPTEWEKLLNASALTKADFKQNPQAVIEVLEFYSDITKRNENPDEYPSLTPTPPIHTSQNKQLGHGGGGTTIAPPRPLPPGSLGRQASYQYQQPRSETPSRSQSNTPIQNQRRPSGPEFSPLSQSQSAESAKLTMDNAMRQAMEEEARRIKIQQEQRERRRAEEAEQNRRDQEAYNAAIPQKSVPRAQQEIGGYSSSPPARFNPTRVAPSAPSERSRQQPQNSSRQASGQRQDSSSQAGHSGTSSSAPRPPFAQKQSPSRDQSPSNGSGSLRSPPTRIDQQQRQPSPSTRQPGNTDQKRNESPRPRAPSNSVRTNGITATSDRVPGNGQAVKPLILNTKATTASPSVTNGVKNVPAAVKQAEIALSQKAPAETGKKEARMSSMSESEVMERLKAIVTKQDPAESYTKQKKIGQGASGSVYVAKIREDAASPIARSAYQRQGSSCRVAIKTMDLRHQPRKELIVNEIIVMKESMHANIVNYLDAFLLHDQNELWVVMEYMDAGAFTDIIEAIPVITEEQIAAICREVSKSSHE